MWNKKAQVPEGMLWIARILFIVVPLIFAIMFFTKGFAVKIDVTPVEAFILSERIHSCFSDEQGVINLKRFNSEGLEKCYDFKEDGGIKVDLTFSEKEFVEEAGQFKFLEPLCELKGKATPYCKEFRKYVLVQEAGELFPASLSMRIILKSE